VVLPSPHDRIRQHPGTGHAALDRQFERVGDEDLGLDAPNPFLAHEFLIQDFEHDGGRGPPLEDGADVSADQLKGAGLALDLGRNDLDLHPRQMCWQRLPHGLATRMRSDLLDGWQRFRRIGWRAA
jgi:hypothetical protein